jgi:hypothetical protein
MQQSIVDLQRTYEVCHHAAAAQSQWKVDRRRHTATSERGIGGGVGCTRNTDRGSGAG